MTSLNYPLLFQPVYKDYLWGGDRIRRTYGRSLPPGTCAESWEISDRPEGMSVVTNGRLAGRSLGELVKEFGERLVGTGCACGRFPLLIKIIDSRLRLSVQVHPADENAAAVNGEPKTEMWYVLRAGAVARVFVGLREAVTKAGFEAAACSRDFEKMLEPVRVRPADAILVPGGTVHCIDEGLLLLEVQQNSNTTFRLHDWDRAGANGEKRPLHIGQAMRSVLWTGRPPAKARRRVLARHAGNTVWDVLECRHFHVERLDLAQPFRAGNDGRSFHAFFVTDGVAGIRGGRCGVTAKAGTSCLMPAVVGKYTISPLKGTARVLRISLGRQG